MQGFAANTHKKIKPHLLVDEAMQFHWTNIFSALIEELSGLVTSYSIVYTASCISIPRCPVTR